MKQHKTNGMNNKNKQASKKKLVLFEYDRYLHGYDCGLATLCTRQHLIHLRFILW